MNYSEAIQSGLVTINQTIKKETTGNYSVHVIQQIPFERNYNNSNPNLTLLLNFTGVGSNKNFNTRKLTAWVTFSKEVYDTIILPMLQKAKVTLNANNEFKATVSNEGVTFPDTVKISYWEDIVAEVNKNTGEVQKPKVKPASATSEEEVLLKDGNFIYSHSEICFTKIGMVHRLEFLQHDKSEVAKPTANISFASTSKVDAPF